MWITAAIVLAILLIAVLAYFFAEPDEGVLRNSQKSAMPYDSMYVSLDDHHPEHKEMK